MLPRRRPPCVTLGVRFGCHSPYEKEKCNRRSAAAAIRSSAIGDQISYHPVTSDRFWPRSGQLRLGRKGAFSGLECGLIKRCYWIRCAARHCHLIVGCVSPILTAVALPRTRVVRVHGRGLPPWHTGQRAIGRERILGPHTAAAFTRPALSQ